MSITVISGGHGAGKTAMALKLASNYKSKVYIATAEAIDEEMQQKIAAHKAERDESYTTLEVPLNISEAVTEAQKSDLIIVDCLTVWLSNLLHYEINVDEAFSKFINALASVKTDIILVTNESSLSIIPPDAVTRRYARLLSSLNKSLACMADNVCLMVSGLPLWLKNKDNL